MAKLNVLSRRGWILLAILIGLTVVGHAATRGVSLNEKQDRVRALSVDFTAPPGGPITFKGRLDRTAVLRGGDGLVKLKLLLSAPQSDSVIAHRVATDFLVVLDRSGSMRGEKINFAISAVRELIDRMYPDDRLALISYSDNARIAIPLEVASPEARSQWQRVLQRIQANGNTNMSSGLDQARELAMQHRTGARPARMILISDGLANRGDTSHQGLTSRARLGVNAEIVTSSVGVGEDFDEFLMSAIADAGTGNFYYLQELSELAAVFTSELEATQETVARGLVVTIDTPPGVEVVDAAGYPLEVHGNRTIFRPGSLFAGQERRIWVTMKVPSDEVSEHSLGRFELSFTHTDDPHAISFTDRPMVACVLGEDEFFQSVDRDQWASAVVEEDFGRLQRNVAEYVKQGKREDALSALKTYFDATQEMNTVMESEAVSDNLAEVKALEAQVQDAFQGDGQKAKQNSLSKSSMAQSVDARRAGSKKSP